MEEKSVGRSFLILSVAGILVKILSAAYIPLLRAIIGKQGIGIYNASYSYFVFILAITSLGAQPAVAKVVSELRALGHEEDALRAMKLARRYLAIIGAVITIGFIVLIEPIAKLTQWENVTLSLMFLAPTVFFSCILATYRGYLQGVEEMKTLAISQVVEQIVNVVLSLIFAFIFINISVEWGSAGGTVGTTIGAIVALIFILVVYDRKRFAEKAEEENKAEKHISDRKILKKLIKYGVPIILVAALQNSSGMIDTINVKGRLLFAGFADNKAEELFGILGCYNTLLYVPLSVVTALSAAVFPKIIQAFTMKKKKELKSQMAYSFRLTYLITIPAAVGLSMLSKEVYIMIYGSTEGYQLLMYGSIVLILMSLSAIQNTILQGINKLYLVLSTAFLSIIIKFVINYILVGMKDINILGAVFASFFAFLVPVIINHIRLRRIFKMRIPIIKLGIIPFMASCVMALSIYLCKIPINRIMNILEGGRLLTSLVALILIAVGGAVYFITMILLGGIKKKDLDMISPRLFTLLPRFLRKNM
ncbi:MULTISPECIES: polysaccharide biosynthesis protein [unclassified Clostridium]|uniref:putative polysaccharide biosynthesis protein n=1 Tax=unclassified Clostridium TaxID=2614128 RepID=UPI001C8C51D5|nr:MULTISPECIES: polysaccharide biosynthesis protein [unclassified Clostridium]MBX9138517.1 polysaccharide biosynthesis protein [Clostridium sp. K12(2020)]MBX9145258.1 polysaccharide biosynthesis protein [Clostridium sp. K13]MDU2288831.1 polysaccharide biosynthesis protein [Clostridium celatum]MDU4325055.1 polysaccharide biosynthesis protein [Clostridium celatum]